MVKKLTNNLGLKLLAILVACIVWLIVINYADPIVSIRYSGIPVEFTNQDLLKSKGKVYEVLNNTDTVDVVIYGKRSVLETLSYENIHAKADLEDITIMNTVAIQVYSNKSNDQLDSIRQSRSVVELNVEDLKEMSYTINVVVNGTPGDGYVIGDISQNKNLVRVSGPESVVRRVAKAECSVGVNGRTSDLSTSEGIRLYDENGIEVTHPDLTQNVNTVDVKVEILACKAVDIIYNYSGEPAEGYTVIGEPVADRTAVYIAGRQAILDKVERIVIPDSMLDISGRDKNLDATLNLKDYLPDGVRMINIGDEEFDGRVNVKVEIQELIERTFAIPIGNLRVENVPKDFKAEVLLETNGTDTDPGKANLEIRVRGIADSYTNVVPKELHGTIDVEAFMEKAGVSELPAGVFRMEVQMELPEGLTTAEKYYADVRITAPEEEETKEDHNNKEEQTKEDHSKDEQ